MAAPQKPSQHRGLIIDASVLPEGATEPEHFPDAGLEGSAQPIVAPPPSPAATSDIPAPSAAAGISPLPLDVSPTSAGPAAHDEAPAPRPPAEGPMEPPVTSQVLEHRSRIADAASAEAAARVGLEELLDDDAGPRSMLERQLDVVGTGPSAPGPVVIARPRRGLSPTMVSIVGTLLGLASVASLIALAVHISPHDAPALSLSAVAGPASSSPPPPPATAPPPRVRAKLPGPWRIADAKNDPALRVASGQVGRDPLLKVLETAGVEKPETYRILASMKGVRDLDKCNRSDRFSVLIERGSKRVKAFEYTVTDEEVYQAKEDAQGRLQGRRLDLVVKHEQWSGAFAMDGDLVRSAARGGFESSIRDVLATALNGHMAIDDIERGDVLRLVAQEVTVLGELSRYAGIEALEYRPSDSKKRAIRIYWFRGKEERGYFDAAGRAPFEGGWRKPIPGAPVTSPFNLNRMHPVLHRKMPHLGVDFGCAMGVPVGAASFGKVTFKGYAGPAGNLVKVEHSDGIETGYAHLSRFAEGLEVGDRVKRLEVVGYCGSTGRSTGPHLHFIAKKKAEYFDPLKLNFDALRMIGKDERPQFEAAKRVYDGLLDALPVPAAPPPVAAAPAEVTPGESMGEEDDDSEAAASGTDPAPVLPPTAAAASAEPATNPSKSGVGSVFLTDKELLERQAREDDGEVAE